MHALLVATAATLSPLVSHGASDPGHAAVVAIVDASGHTTCSGTLVDPHFVLTAAHCAVPQIAHGASVVAGASVASPGATAPIVAMRTHPAYDPATFADDAGLLVLGAGLPVMPATLGPDPPANGSTLTAVGWGETSGDAGDYGTKRSGTVLVTNVSALSFDVAPGPSLPCVGDSGGAAFAGTGAGELLVGITSHGDDACAVHATYTRVDAVTADFVRPTLAALGPGTARPGSRCLFPEQCSGGAGTCVGAPDQPGLAYCTQACALNADCPKGMTCAAMGIGHMECLYPVPTPGAFGGSCSADADCYDGVCVAGTCTMRCVPTGDSCPAGATCQEQGGGIDFYCVPAPAPAPTGGCSVERRSRAGRAAALTLALATLLAVARARRRRRSPW